jgi:serine protease Do
MAVLKIEGTNLPTVELGDSTALQVGQTVIAIGNALGEFRNTVSTGVISGLARTVMAGGMNMSEQLTDVIQTDASINPGNSGGPLLNLLGQVIGINTAVVQMAQNIGFAIPINSVKDNIASVQQNGRIIRPWLGINYLPVTSYTAKLWGLPMNYGIRITSSSPYDPAVINDSPAAKAGLQRDDVILEMGGSLLDENTSLLRLIAKHKPGDVVKLKVWRNGEEKEIAVTLEEMTKPLQ